MKKFFAVAAACLIVAACGKDGGNGNGGGGLSHNELADVFVQSLNATGNYNVSLAKSSTLREDYIVIYDINRDEYDAVDLSGYLPGADAAAFLQTQTAVFHDLDVLPGHYEYFPTTDYNSDCDCWVSTVETEWVPTRYRDRFSGFVFEKTSATNKDLQKYGALIEEKVVSSRAHDVSAKFGLSVERSKEVVRLAMAWKKAGGKDLTVRDQDAFSRELLGFSISEAKAAIKDEAAGNNKSIENLVELAAEANGTTPENVRQVIDEYFSK